MTTITTIQQAADLRHALYLTEKRLGLTELSHTDRDVYYAASDLSRQGDAVQTGSLMHHRLVDHIPRQTFYRALKSLIAGGYLIPCGRGRYQVKEAG